MEYFEIPIENTECQHYQIVRDPYGGVVNTRCLHKSNYMARCQKKGCPFLPNQPLKSDRVKPIYKCPECKYSHEFNFCPGCGVECHPAT